MHNLGTINSIGSHNEFTQNKMAGLFNDRKAFIGSIGSNNIFSNNGAGLYNLGTINSLGKDNQFLQNKIGIFDAGTIKAGINNSIFRGILAARPSLNPEARNIAESLAGTIGGDYAYARDRLGPDWLYHGLQDLEGISEQVTGNVSGAIDAGGRYAFVVLPLAAFVGRMEAEERAFGGKYDFNAAWHARAVDDGTKQRVVPGQFFADRVSDHHQEPWMILRAYYGAADTLAGIPKGFGDRAATPLYVYELPGLAHDMTIGMARDLYKGFLEDPAYAAGGIGIFLISRGRNPASLEGLSVRQALGQVGKEVALGTGENALKLAGVTAVILTADKLNQLAGGSEGSSTTLAAILPFTLSKAMREEYRGRLDGKGKLTTPDARKLAADLGFTKERPEKVHGQRVFENPKTGEVLSRDEGSGGLNRNSHEGAVFK